MLVDEVSAGEETLADRELDVLYERVAPVVGVCVLHVGSSGACEAEFRIRSVAYLCGLFGYVHDRGVGTGPGV